MAKQANHKVGKKSPQALTKTRAPAPQQKAQPSRKLSAIKNTVKGVGKKLLKVGAGLLGNQLGGPVVGSLFSSVASTLTGSGDYKVIPTGAAQHDIPSFGNILDAGINIKNREFIGTVSSSVALNQWKIAINPGQTETFPFLSRIAANFEKYRFRGLVFYYKSTAAAAFSSNTNIALGQVILTSVPDPAEAQPTTLEAVLNRKDNSVGKPSEDILHGWECKKGLQVLNEYYIRTAANGEDEDIRFTDPGYLLLSTNANPAASMEIGQLWVSYDVDLMVPKLSVSGEGYLVKTDRFINFSGITAAYPLGDAAGDKQPVAGSTLGCVISGASNAIIFPPGLDSGTFLVNISYKQAEGSVKPPLSFTLYQCALVSTTFQKGAATFYGMNHFPHSATVTEDETMLQLVVNVTAKNAYLTLSTDATFTSSIYCTVIVTEVNPSAMTAVSSDEAQLYNLFKKLGLKKKSLAMIKEMVSDKDSCWSFE